MPPSEREEWEKMIEVNPSFTIRVPKTLGFTGKSFNGAFKATNRSQREPGFNVDIDNLSQCGRVFSFLSGPIKSGELTTGVFQFVNERHQTVTKFDVWRLKLLSPLLAKWIENCKLLTRSVNVTVQIRSEIFSLKTMLKSAER